MGEDKVKVLIVDDEFIMRQGLRYMIDWETEGYEIVGEAVNGQEALERIKELSPHIVICDVVMPLMDGVDFTVAVHHMYPHIQMIILSGYDNFEYVKQTLMNGVVDYILKPTLTPKELLDVLKKAVDRIPGQHFTNNTGSIDYSEVLKRVLLTRDTEEIPVLATELTASSYIMYAVNISQADECETDYSEALLKRIERSMQDFSGFHYLSTLLHEEQFCILFGYEMSQRGSLRIKLEKLHGQLGLICKSVVSVISRSYMNLDETGRIYQEDLARSGDLPFYFPDKTMFVMDSEKNLLNGNSERLDFSKYNRLLIGEQYRQAADQFLKYNNSLLENHMDVRRMKNQTKNMYQVFLEQIQITDEQRDERFYQFGQKIDHAYKGDDYRLVVEEGFEELITLASAQLAQVDGRMNQITEYIEQHYQEDIKLEDLAEKFGYSYHYLSAYFNQQVKEGFNDYLNRVRINKACKLLQDPSISVAQVSEMVGYLGHSYFCRVFKKYTGSTPTEWRRNSIEK